MLELESSNPGGKTGATKGLSHLKKATQDPLRSYAPERINETKASLGSLQHLDGPASPQDRSPGTALNRL